MREDKGGELGTQEWDIQEEFLHQDSFLSWRMWLKVLGQCVLHPFTSLRLLSLFLKRLYSNPVQFAKTLGVAAKALSFLPDIEELDISIIHAPWGEYPSVAAFVMHRMCPKIGFTMSLIAYDYDSRFALVPDMVESSMRIFVNSEERKRQVIEEWPRTNQPVSCVYHGVNLVTHNIDNSIRYGIITVATLAPYKGLHILIESLNILKSRGIDVQTKIIGRDSPEDPLYSVNLRRQARKLGLVDQIEFTGPLHHEQVLQAMASAELFVLPSLYNDVLPNAIKEALSLKLPVIVTPTVGIGELIQNKQSGLIIPKNDPVALADAIDWALQKPEAMDQMAILGHSIVVDKFDIKKTSAQRSNFYEQLLT